MSRETEKSYCYVGTGEIVPLPKKTRPGEWFGLFTHDTVEYEGIFRRAELGLELFEVETSANQVHFRLTRRVGIINQTALRLFMAACAEHVLDVYERARDDGAARRAISASLEYVANGGNLTEAHRQAMFACVDCTYDRYEVGRAMCAATFCVQHEINAFEARFCAREAAMAVRVDKRNAEYEWQRKMFLKTIKAVAKGAQ